MLIPNPTPTQYSKNAASKRCQLNIKRAARAPRCKITRTTQMVQFGF